MRRLAGIYQNFLRVAVASRKGSDCVGCPLRPARRVMMTWFVVVTACNAAFARTLEVWSVPRHSVLSTSISCPISRFPPSSSFPFSLPQTETFTTTTLERRCSRSIRTRNKKKLRDQKALPGSCTVSKWLSIPAIPFLPPLPNETLFRRASNSLSHCS